MTTQEPEIERAEGAPAAMETLSPAGMAGARRVPAALRSAAFGAVLYLAFFSAMTLFNAWSPSLTPVVWAALAPLTTVAYLLILVYTINLLCRLPLTARVETLVMVVALFIFVAINPNAHEIIWGVITGKSVDEVLAHVGAQQSPILEVLIPFFLILTGVYFGQLLSRIIREASLLVPVALVAGLIDFWGVYWGPVSEWSEQTPQMVNMATAATAMARMPEAVQAQLPQQWQIFGSIAPPESIGIGDFVFIAFFLACAYRLGFSARRTMGGIVFGLLACSLVMTMDSMTLFGREIAIDYLPGLVFICGGALLANLTHWRLSRQEWAMTGVLVAVLVGVISISIVRAEMHKPRIDATRYYTTAAATKQQLVEEALARVAGQHARRGEMIILDLDGYYLYGNTQQCPELRAFRLIALIRPHNPQLRSTYEVSIYGECERNNPKRWTIVGQTASPPENVLGQILPVTDDDALATIRQARGAPPAALKLLDQIEEMPAEKDQQLILSMTPDKIVLLDYSPPNQQSPRELQTFDLQQFDGR